ncbi:MAG: alpha/beta fold hydrolase [Hyphomicrobiales bacterium]|nr:alpha/beta fold hydrolase [Hyphomicrobiales bacterium]
MYGSIAFLWPALLAMETGRATLAMAEQFANLVAPAAPDPAVEPPRWTTPNKLALELRSLKLRDFSTKSKPGQTPTLVCPPFALHGATIADFARGHSLVQALRDSGIHQLFLTEWRSATPETRFMSIDSLLADLNVAIDELGGRVNLIGLCQGGWMALAYAARFPAKVTRLVIVGAPIDIDAGESVAATGARMMPLSLFRDIVDLGDGRVLGRHALGYWDAAAFDSTTIRQILQIPAADSRQLEERFEEWHAWTLDLPGTYYLEVVEWLFMENRLAKANFVALGHRLDLSNVTTPVFLLAGLHDEVVAQEQLFATEGLVGTKQDLITKRVVDSGHLGLFMGHQTMREAWPAVARWLVASPPHR